MKTKNVILLLILSLPAIVLAKTGSENAFAAVGTEWYYGFKGALFGSYERTDYYQFSSVSDTLIAAKQGYVIEQKHGSNGCRPTPQKMIVSQSNDTVYLWIPELNQFTPFYVFGAGKGDSWEIQHPDGNVKVTVDSVSSITMFDSSVRKQFVTYRLAGIYGDLTEKSSIIEGIGDENYLYNYRIHGQNVCDDNRQPLGLRCFTNPTKGTYKTRALSCDTIFNTDLSVNTSLKDGDTWNVAFVSGWWGGITYQSFSNYIKGDTILHSIAYKIVYDTGDSVYINGRGNKSFYLREEKGRWYYIHSFESEETLLYDFNLNAGDTINVRPFNARLRILKVDSIYISGVPHKRLSIGRTESYYGDDYVIDHWIEGIGSLNGILYDYWIVDGGSSLLCYRHNGELVYMNPNWNTCWMVSSVNPIQETTPLTIKNSGSNSEFEVQCKDEITELSIVDMAGVVVFKSMPNSNRSFLSLRHQSKGVYIVRVKTENGIYVCKIAGR